MSFCGLKSREFGVSLVGVNFKVILYSRVANFEDQSTVHSPEILESNRVVVGLLADLVVDLDQLQFIAVRIHIVSIVDALYVDLVVENWNINALDRNYVTCGPREAEKDERLEHYGKELYEVELLN